MQYNIDSTDYAVELSAVNLDVALTFGVPLDVTIGESARLDVGEAVNYIKSGQAEIEQAVRAGVASFDINATQKTATFNNNADDKINAFNSNATGETAEFNNNVLIQTAVFNENVNDKTTGFDTNVADKVAAFNQNAVTKTDDFNDNAVDKTAAYNDNASTKTTAFNSNYSTKKALIDAEVANASASATVASNSADLAKQWAIGNPSEPSGNSAKYWAEQAASTYNNKANIDLSNLSASGEVKFDAKQDTLVSGTNIKTINGNSLLGSGNIEIQGGGGAYTAGDGIDITSDTISIKSSIVNGAELGTTALQVGDNISDLNNDSGYITTSALTGYATENWVNSQGYLTGITSSDVTTALGYTPYNATNPNGYITSSALNGYALDTDVVHKTGTETIAGEKTFTSKLRIDSGGIEITPELSASHGGYIDFHYAGSTDDYTSRIIENSQGNIAIKSTTVTAPASDVNGSIVTTVNKSKSANGYFKLGNGLIIQWGRASGTITSSNMTITFPIPFTSASSYSVSGNITYNRSTGNGWGHINSCTSTGFNAVVDNDEKPFNWIAIGY